jgi:chromate transport protein ChrA
MSGGCSSFYASTLTSLVSAFGITVLDLTHVLVPVAFVLVGKTLYSIYYSTISLTYPPLLVALAGAVLITLSHCVTHEVLLLYSGNLVLIGGVLWNNKQIKDITSVTTVEP